MRKSRIRIKRSGIFSFSFVPSDFADNISQKEKGYRHKCNQIPDKSENRNTEDLRLHSGQAENTRREKQGYYTHTNDEISDGGIDDAFKLSRSIKLQVEP